MFEQRPSHRATVDFLNHCVFEEEGVFTHEAISGNRKAAIRFEVTPIFGLAMEPEHLVSLRLGSKFAVCMFRTRFKHARFAIMF